MSMKFKKSEVAYCLVRKNSFNEKMKFSPLLFDGRMPIYWNKKVAKEEAVERNCDFVKVVVKPDGISELQPLIFPTQ